jgi:hypothetical protein
MNEEENSKPPNKPALTGLTGGRSSERLVEEFLDSRNIDFESFQTVNTCKIWIINADPPIELAIDYGDKASDNVISLITPIASISLSCVTASLVRALECAHQLISSKISLYGNTLLLSCTFLSDEISRELMEIRFEQLIAQREWFINELASYNLTFS